jgi:translation initiation factor 2B subunit (eIF-2B alpha/beta/delta family)
MILEQRYGAAQVVMRVTDALLLRAAAGRATSPDTFRREMFRTGWMFVCERRAVASLVNLVNAMLSEDCDTPQELQAAVQNVISHFRHQLNQRVLDTATHSLSLLSTCRHILTHGYSATVHYALQHALRNGQRLHVTYITPAHAGESQALRERISAIGLTVDTLSLATDRQRQLVAMTL